MTVFTKYCKNNYLSARAGVPPNIIPDSKSGWSKRYIYHLSIHFAPQAVSGRIFPYPENCTCLAQSSTSIYIKYESPYSKDTGYQTPNFSLACYEVNCKELRTEELKLQQYGSAVSRQHSWQGFLHQSWHRKHTNISMKSMCNLIQGGFVMWFIYFLLCVLLPICVPVPEITVVLWGTEHIGSLAAFLLGVTGSVLGLAVMYNLSSLIACHMFKRKKERKQLIWLQQLTKQHRYLALGVLLIVPLVSDEILCVGSAFFKIPLSQFLKIGIIAKIISIGMVSFSGLFGVLCGLERWQIIAAELLMMFLASVNLQYFCKKEEAKRNHERIYIDY